MFPSQRSMEISALLFNNFSQLLNTTANAKRSLVHEDLGEIDYFRAFFKNLEHNLNNIEIGDIHFVCRSTEIHQKPIVIFGSNQSCELGDYFVNVKYYDEGKLLGKKLVIYQFKMEERKQGNSRLSNNLRIARKWSIDPTQNALLINWPTFRFGKKKDGYHTFRLSPRTPDLGSYWLVHRNEWASCHYGFDTSLDFILPAICVPLFKKGKSLPISYHAYSPLTELDSRIYFASHLMWRNGELVEQGSLLDDFLGSLYRFIGLEPDPPFEFEGFMSNESERKIFGGLEISVKRNTIR